MAVIFRTEDMLTGTDAPALESREQLIGVWSSIALAVDPDADLRELPGIKMLWAESRFGLWRSATLTGTGTDAGELAVQLKEVAEIFRTKSRPGLLWVFEDLLAPDAHVRLSRPPRRRPRDRRRRRPL